MPIHQQQTAASPAGRRLFGLADCRPIFAGLLLATAASGDVQFPADAGVIDVAAFGAVPDDGLDDTAAIQAALDANPSGNKIFFFADGVYDISGTLAPAEDDGVTKRNIFQGQSRDGVVLKLADNLGFTGAVIDYNANAVGGAPPAQFFRNAVRDLTVDVGSGNPSATGIRFNASNQGTVRNVTIRSTDGGGSTGLITGGNEPGPLLIQNVKIDGFDVGLRTLLPTASQTVEHLTLRNQNQAGWVNDVTQQVFGRGVDFQGDVRAIDNRDQSRMLLIDSTLVGDNPASFEAIRNNKRMYLRDVSTSGFTDAVNNGGVVNIGRGNLRAGPDDENVIEFWANGAFDSTGGTARRGGTFELFDSPDTSLRMPIREHPTRPYAPLNEWDSPLSHQIDLGGGQISGLPDDGIDDTPAIQAAINAGASTIYLPNGTWRIDGTVLLGNNVERLTGAEARIQGQGAIRVVDGAADEVFIERLENVPVVQHATTRTVVLEHLLGFDYQVFSATPGDVFLNDVTGGAVTFSSGQNVWARQLNLEAAADATDPNKPDAKVVNDGANVWILGLKTEDPGTWIRTVNGGRTELLGGVKVGSGATFGADNAMFVTEDSSLFVALPLIAAGEGYEFVAKETRNGETRLANGFNLADAFSAFAADAIADREVIVDNRDPAATVEGDWTATDSFPGGFLDEDFLFTTPGAGKRVVFSPDTLEDGSYEVFVRWVFDRSGQDHSNHASNARFIVEGEDGSAQFTVDMTNGGGGFWKSLGVFNFAGDGSDAVILDADGANGKLIADAVRFLRVFQFGDIDGDGDIDADDIDSFQGSIGQPASVNPPLDLNGDGMIDLADHALLVDDLVQTDVGAGTVFGDVDLNGTVNGLDVSAVVANFGGAGGWAQGDFNADGVVNGLDVSAVVANFGQTPPAAAAVPEPTSMGLLVAAGLGAWSGRRPTTNSTGK